MYGSCLMRDRQLWWCERMRQGMMFLNRLGRRCWRAQSSTTRERLAAALLEVELKALFVSSLQHLLGIQFETQWRLAPLQTGLDQSDSFPEEQA